MLTFELSPIVAADGFTQSELTCMDDCGKKWFWRYHEQLTRRGSFHWSLVIGDAVHKTLEQMYATKGETWEVKPFRYPSGVILDPSDSAKEKLWYVIVDAMMTAYSQHYYRDFEEWEIEKIEETVEVEFMGFKFKGKIDLRYRNIGSRLDWITDHKTTFRLGPDITAMWEFKFQFMFYLWLMWKSGRDDLNGYQINAIRRPELRLGKTEGFPEFGERIRQDMVHEPQKYFYRNAIKFDVDMLRHFENRVLLPKVERLVLLSGDAYKYNAASAIAHNMNTDACYRYGKPCEFLALCMQAPEDFLHEYDKRSSKHEELEGESAE